MADLSTVGVFPLKLAHEIRFLPHRVAESSGNVSDYRNLRCHSDNEITSHYVCSRGIPVLSEESWRNNVAQGLRDADAVGASHLMSWRVGEEPRLIAVARPGEFKSWSCSAESLERKESSCISMRSADHKVLLRADKNDPFFTA